jgi:putative membrane protein
MHQHPHHQSMLDYLLSLSPIIVITTIWVLYLIAVATTNRSFRKWPYSRLLYWSIGVFLVLIAITGPLATRAHYDFTAHMFAHLFLGMLSPLLIVLAAPMTLILRTINVNMGRRLTRIFKSWPIRIISDPAIASILNIGGLWLLYTTPLYAIMHEHTILHLLVHIHIFLAGYVFTSSIIYFDPSPHRTSYFYRAIVLILALAGHSILSKHIFAHPPSSVSLEQAEIGSMLMYYGGDLIDLIIIIIFCYQWYRDCRPKGVIFDNKLET